MKKILLVDRTTPDVGGVRTYVKNLTILLESLGYQVDNYTTVHNGSLIDKYFIAGIRFISNRIYRPIGIIIDNYLFNLLFNFILPRSYDKYILQQPTYLSEKNKKNVICIIHSILTDNLQGYKINSNALHLCLKFEKYLLTNNYDINFTVSDAYSEYLTNKFDFKKKIKYIDNFLVENFISLEWDRKTIDIIYTGQFNERKNLFFILDFLKIYNKMTNSKLKIYLLGDGHLRENIEKSINQDSLDDQIKIIISPDRDKIKKYLSESKILILPSLKETFSYSLLEAKLSGCITFATKGLEVPDGFIDYPINLENPKDMIDPVRKVLSNGFDPQNHSKNFTNPLEVARKKYENILSI